MLTYITSSPETLHVVELVPIQSEVLLHTRDESIVDVALIQVLHQVSE